MLPEAAPARWRGAVRVALEHRRRFDELASVMPHGPLRDRVEAMRARVEGGVEVMWDLVQQGAVAERALAVSAPETAADRLKQARRALADQPDDPELAARVDALTAAHGSAQRVWNTVEDLDDRLAMVDMRLAALVASVAELAAGITGADGMDRAVHDLDTAVAELGATRLALDELGQL